MISKAAKRIVVRAVVVTIASLAIIAGYAFYRVWVTDGCACGLSERTPFRLLNPFVTREPRRIAARALIAAEDGTCSQLPVVLFSSPQIHEEFCDVHGHHLTHFELRSIGAGPDYQVLGYGASYDGNGSDGSGVGIQLSRTNGAWKITGKDAFY